MPDKREAVSHAAVRRFMGTQGCEIVARDAVDGLRYHLKDLAVTITKEAKMLMKHAGRGMVSADDIALAIHRVTGG